MSNLSIDKQTSDMFYLINGQTTRKGKIVKSISNWKLVHNFAAYGESHAPAPYYVNGGMYPDASDYYRVAEYYFWIAMFDKWDVDYIAHKDDSWTYIFAKLDTKDKREKYAEVLELESITWHDDFWEFEDQAQRESLEADYRQTIEYDYEFTGDAPSHDDFYNAWIELYDYQEFGQYLDFNDNRFDKVLEHLGYKYGVATFENLETDEHDAIETCYKANYEVKLIFGDTVVATYWYDWHSALIKTHDLFNNFEFKPYISGYRLQNMGVNEIMEYRKDTISNIPYIVKVKRL